MKKIIFTAILFCLCLGLYSQNVTISGALSGNGSYASLGTAFAAINASAQTGATINVSIIASTTETSSAVLNAGAWSSLSVFPSGGSPRVVSGNIAGALVDLNGADNVVINGMNTSGNSLTLLNSNTGNLSTSTVRFMADATNNVVTNCNIQGSSTSSLLATVVFTLAGTAGNSSNTVSTCNIGPAGTNLPTNAIYSAGNSGNINSNNTITNNSIYDYFDLNQPSSGITLSVFNTGWMLSGNRFYQTSARTYTNTGIDNVHSGIQILSGNSHTVSANIVGYSSSASSGIYDIGSSGSGIKLAITGVNLSVGSLTATSVQSNTFTAIKVSGSASTTYSNIMFSCVNYAAGNVDIGNIGANVFGANTGTGQIQSYTYGGYNKTCGISGVITSGTVSVQNNIFGGISSEGVSAAYGGTVMAIHVYPLTLSSRLSVTGNIIGNASANNLRAGVSGTTTDNTAAYGYYCPNTGGGFISVSGNTVQNLASFGSGGNSCAHGISTSTVGYAGQEYTVSANVIKNITAVSGLRAGTSGQLDIGATGIHQGFGSNVVIGNNTITAISMSGSSTYGCIVAGIQYSNIGNGKVFNNKISNITNTQGSSSFTAPAIACGVNLCAGSGTVLVQNNFISLGNGSTDNTSFIGIMSNNMYVVNHSNFIYHNTINIEGNAGLGTQPTFGYYRGCFGTASPSITVVLRNNLITNNRTGSFSAHYAIANSYGASSTSTFGFGATASDYNILNSTNSLTTGYWGANMSLAGWQSASGGDANSYSGVAVTYSNSASDLHINMGTTPNYIESRAVLIPTLTIDIDGQTRPGPTGSTNGGGLAPDIGADEFDGVILDAIAPAITYSLLPTICNNVSRTLTATISDFTGVPTTGTVIPRVYYKKNSNAYQSSAGSLLSGSGLNGTWGFTLSYSALGGVSDNDVISYFVIAQDQAASPNLGSNPVTGLVASNVNSVTTPPTITTQTFTVKLIPSVSTNSGTICSGSSFTINPSGASTYTVSGGSFVVSPATSASYSVSGTGTNGCASTVAAVSNVSVNASPVITAPGGSICAGQAFTISPSGAASYTYSSGSAVVTPTISAGVINYSVSGTNSLTCVSQSPAIVSLTVSAIPTISANSGTICQGQSFTIIAAGAASYTYSGGSNIVTPATSANYSVTGTSAAGCAAGNTAVCSVSLLSLPVISVNSGTICSGSSFTINPSGASSYTIAGGVFVVSPTTSSVYSVSGTGSNGCVSSSPAVSNVMVNPLPSISASAVNPTICSGEAAGLQASGATTYTWSNSVQGASISVSPGANTIYTVTGTDANGCRNTATVLQSVSACLGVATNNSQAVKIRIYPNPNKGEFIIENAEQGILTVINSLGELVYTSHLDGLNTQAVSTNLANGVYLIRIENNSGVQSMRLIISR